MKISVNSRVRVCVCVCARARAQGNDKILNFYVKSTQRDFWVMAGSLAHAIPE